MLNAKTTPRYEAARRIFDDILHKRPPNHELLVFLHGKSLALVVVKAINRFYSDPRFIVETVRSHDSSAPNILSNMRKLMDNDPDFSALDEYFGSQTSRTEGIDAIGREIRREIGENFKNKFGPYSEHAIMVSALVISNRLKRKSGISTLNHWNGAAGIIYSLQEVKVVPEYHDRYFRTIVTFLHDFEEDLPSKIMHKDGTPYGLNRSTELGRDYLPDNELIVRDVNILTNLYTEIIKSGYEFLKKGSILFTIDGFKDYLEGFMREDAVADPSMRAAYSDLYSLISGNDYSSLTGKDLLTAISWDAYTFYVNKILADSVKFDDDTPILAKFCDQAYNFIGKEGLSDVELMKDMLKVWLWSSHVYSRDINSPYLQDFARELLEDTLCYSEYYVIRDFMRREAVLPFYVAAFQKILTLLPIFYENENISQNKSYP